MWGPPAAGRQIMVNGRSHLIRQNLFDFLLQAILEPSFLGATALWIDQLCIDQHSIVERNHQVARMSQLYQSADCVLIWLGRGNDVSRAVMTGLQSSSVLGQGWNREAHKVFASHPYWRRLWIVQEVLLARRLMIAWDSQTLDWSKLADMVRDKAGSDKEDHLDVLFRYRDLRVDAGAFYLSWHEALDLGRGKACTVPYDRLYGLLGILEERYRVVPDYIKPLQAIVAEIFSLAYGKGRFWDFSNREWDLLCTDLGIDSKGVQSEIEILVQRYREHEIAEWTRLQGDGWLGDDQVRKGMSFEAIWQQLRISRSVAMREAYHKSMERGRLKLEASGTPPR